MLLETISTFWKKALSKGQSTSQSFWTPQVLTVRPDAPTAGLPVSVTGQAPDGVYAAAGTPPGMFTQNRVQLMPWSEGAVGTQFSVRLWGLTAHGTETPLWMPMFLAEFLCTTGATSGVITGTANDPLSQTFPVTGNLCDTITLTQGTLGPTGEINSTGPGTNIPAWAIVEIKGSQWWFLDFQMVDAPSANAFWKYV